jgi:hypothetical protein
MRSFCDPLKHIPNGAWEVLERLTRYSETAYLEEFLWTSPRMLKHPDTVAIPCGTPQMVTSAIQALAATKQKNSYA